MYNNRKVYIGENIMDESEISKQLGWIGENCSEIEQLLRITRDSSEFNELYRHTLMLDLILEKVNTLRNLVDKLDITISHQGTGT